MIAPEPFFEPRGTPFSEFHRIRALTVEQPNIELRRAPGGEWNLALQPSTTPGAYSIEQILVNGGTFGVEWAPGLGGADDNSADSDTDTTDAPSPTGTSL